MKVIACCTKPVKTTEKDENANNNCQNVLLLEKKQQFRVIESNKKLCHYLQFWKSNKELFSSLTAHFQLCFMIK